MQRTERSGLTPEIAHDEGEGDERRRTLVAAAVVLLLMVAMLLTWQLSKPAGPETPTGTTQPGTDPAEDHSLTNEEAISRFKELDALRIQAYMNRDASLVSAYVSKGSPLESVNREEIKQLLRDNVRFRPQLNTRNIRVRVNTPDEIVILHVVIERPRFVSESGEDVSASRRAILQKIEWTLRSYDGIWKLYDADVLDSEVVRK